MQMKVRKAIVLAAGHGTRLRPFTCATPKPLMPVWGEPMLGRIVAMLRSWGVDDIAFNTHCLHEQVKAWADGYRRGAAAAGDKVKINQPLGLVRSDASGNYTMQFQLRKDTQSLNPEQWVAL